MLVVVMDNQVSIAWRVVAFVTIAIATDAIGVNAIPRVYNETGVYRCQGKAYDFYSCKSLSQM